MITYPKALIRLSALICLTLNNSFDIVSQLHPDSLIHIEVQGSDTDPFITLDGSAKKNQVFYNPTSQTRSTLLLLLVGSIDNPNSTIQFPTLAANNGFHCINLMYRNLMSGQAACGDIPDTDCHLNYRKEIIEGIIYILQVLENNNLILSQTLIKN